jgi:hypothetical protein
VRQAAAEALTQVVRGLGWVQEVGPPLLLLAYSVKAGTVMQLGPPLAALRAKQLLYVRDAGVSAEGEVATAGAFAGALARLWALKWENSHKEALWRVAANACWSFPKNAARRAAGVAMPLCPACAVEMCDGDRRLCCCTGVAGEHGGGDGLPSWLV